MFDDDFEYVAKLGNSYKICIITGIILLISYYCYAFGFSSSAKPSGIAAVLVCLSPAATAFLMLFEGMSVGAGLEAVLTAALVVHILSMFWIVSDLIKKIPTPQTPQSSRALVLISRIWTFTSIGLLILVIIYFILDSKRSNNSNRR